MITVTTTSTTDNTVWWGHYTQHEHVVMPDVTIGKAFKVSGLADNRSAGIDFAVKVVEDCGLHLFRSDSDASKIKRITTATPIAIHSGRGGDGNLGTINLLAINNGTASHTSGCKVKLNIAGYEFEAKSTAAGARPDTSITVNANNNQLRVELPAWQASWGTVNETKLFYSTDGGGSWKENNLMANWPSQANQYDSGTWSTPATQNQALVSNRMTVGGNTTTWWYYAQGS